jgi:hypothetical protein
MTPNLRHTLLQLGGEGNGGRSARADLKSAAQRPYFKPKVYRCAWRLRAEEALADDRAAVHGLGLLRKW